MASKKDRLTILLGYALFGFLWAAITSLLLVYFYYDQRNTDNSVKNLYTHTVQCECSHDKNICFCNNRRYELRD